MTTNAAQGLKFGLLTVLVVIAMWVLGAWPAYLLAGADGLVGSATAAAICLVAAGVCTVAQQWAVGRGANWELGVFFGGMLFRMGVVLAAVFALTSTGVFGFGDFVLWVILFYLAALGVETVHAHRLLRNPKP